MDEKLYRAMKALTRYPEWRDFEDRIKFVIDSHKESSVNYSAKNKASDAQRQAWIAEGLLEAIEEPQSIMTQYDFTVKAYNAQEQGPNSNQLSATPHL